MINIEERRERDQLGRGKDNRPLERNGMDGKQVEGRGHHDSKCPGGSIVRTPEDREPHRVGGKSISREAKWGRIYHLVPLLEGGEGGMGGERGGGLVILRSKKTGRGVPLGFLLKYRGYARRGRRKEKTSSNYP